MHFFQYKNESIKILYCESIFVSCLLDSAFQEMCVMLCALLCFVGVYTGQSNPRPAGFAGIMVTDD